MSSSTPTPVPHDGRMDPSQPRFGGPTRRRSFTPAKKLEHLAAYEAALGQGRLIRSEVLKLLRWRERPPTGRATKTWLCRIHPTLVGHRGKRCRTHQESI